MLDLSPQNIVSLDNYVSTNYISKNVRLKKVRKSANDTNVKIDAVNKTPVQWHQRGVNYYEVLKLRQNNPCFTLQTIGDIVGLTKERVRQLLKHANLNTKSFKGISFCINCGCEIKGNNRLTRLFCSKQCRYQYNEIPLYCDTCGKLFYRQKHIVAAASRKGYKHNFCSQHCKGVHLGTYKSKPLKAK